MPTKVMLNKVIFVRKEFKVTRIIGVFIFIVIAVVALIIPFDKLLEFIFIWHKKVLIIMGILFIGKELYEFIGRLIQRISTKKLIGHLLWSLIFIGLLFADFYIFENFIRPKLAKLEVLYPKNGAEVTNLFTDVKIFVRAVEDQSIYIIVKTPQRTMYLQEKLFTKEFKDELIGKAQLGEGRIGIGETFEIFAIATKEELKMGVLPSLPLKYISSSLVEVRRVE